MARDEAYLSQESIAAANARDALPVRQPDDIIKIDEHEVAELSPA